MAIIPLLVGYSVVLGLLKIAYRDYSRRLAIIKQ